MLNTTKKGFQKKIFVCFIKWPGLFFLLVFSFGHSGSLKKEKPPGFYSHYMDQVVTRKKKLLKTKCLKLKDKKDKGFMMLELKVSLKGAVDTRVMNTEIKSKKFIQCALNVLNRTHFKTPPTKTLSRIYRFFIL